MKLVFNTQELEKISGLSHFYQLTYVYLRAKANSKSGLVGEITGRKISLQAISEWLYVEPGPGIKASGSPSIKRIRVALQALVRSGLIENRSIATKEHKQLILYLPHAKSDKFVQNKVGMNGAYKQGIQLLPKLPPEKGGELAISVSKENHSAMQSGMAQPLEEGKPHNNKYKYSIKQDDKYAIADDFNPSVQLLEKIHEMDLSQYHNIMQLQKFIAYYKSESVLSADWDSKYLYWVINAREYKLKGEIKNGQSHFSPTRKTLSAVDRVRQANQSL